MMKKLCLLALILLAPLPAFAAAFTATVDSDRVAAGEGFTLQLSLSGTTAKEPPDFDALKPSFDIIGQAQTSNMSIVNGHVNSSTGWQLTLIPKKTGSVTVPSIAVDTDNGQLRTQPIALNVSGSTPQQQPQGAASPQAFPYTGRDVEISAAASESSPYISQPIVYTLRIVARQDVSGLSLGDVAADNAIVKPQGKPESMDAVENGVPVKIVTLRYLITPVKAGTLTIPPVTLQGDIVGSASMPGFATGGGFIDPMAVLQQMANFSGLAQGKPFSIASNAVKLDVKAPAAAMDPWLPLKDLQIDEKIDAAQPVKVGDPVALTFTLRANGIGGAQMPDLTSQLSAADFKIYADKPKSTESVDASTGDILGQRTESFSLIPLKPGVLTVPEIKIPWWNTKTDSVSYATVPARDLDVLPASPTSLISPDAPNQQAAAHAAPQPPQQPAVTAPMPWFWYALVSFLGIALLSLALWAAALQRKINRQKASIGNANAPSSQPAPKPQRPDDIAWEKIRTAEDLSRSLLAYAHDHWGTPPHMAVEAMLEQQKEKMANDSDRAEIETVIRAISVALYANKPIDLDDIKEKCRRIAAAVDTPAKIVKDPVERLPRLNPS